MNVRCSALDKIFLCPPSVLVNEEEQIKISPMSDAASVGTFVHELAAHHISGTEASIDYLKQRHGLSEEDFIQSMSLFEYMTKVWDKIGKFFVVPKAETSVSADINGDVTITGTIDCVSPHGSKDVIFVDWKTGFLDNNYINQITGYAYCLWSFMGKPDDINITGIVAFLRLKYYRVIKFDVEKLLAWEYDLTHNILGSPTTYRPNNYCNYCDRFYSCPARKAITQETIDDMLNAGLKKNEFDKAIKIISTIDNNNKHIQEVADAVNTIMLRCRLISKTVSDARDVVRAACEKVDGIPLGNDDYLVAKEQQRRGLRSAEALSVMRKRLSDSQIASCISVSLTALMSVYGKIHKKNERRDAKKQILSDLEDAGAITVSKFTKLETINIPPEGDSDGPN